MATIKHTSSRTAVVAIAALLLAPTGCNESQELSAPAVVPAVEVTPAVAKPSDKPLVLETTAQPPTPDGAATSVATSDAAAVTPTPAESETAEPTVAEYQPPFPERVDLFVPPKRQGGVRLEGESEDAVELMGFIRLDRQQAVLSINGQITRIAEGATQYGVEVISIQPPKVVLQRGRQRWQASLEN